MTVLAYWNFSIVRYIAIDFDGHRTESVLLTSPFWDLKESIRLGKVLWTQRFNYW